MFHNSKFWCFDILFDIAESCCVMVTLEFRYYHQVKSSACDSFSFNSNQMLYQYIRIKGAASCDEVACLACAEMEDSDQTTQIQFFLFRNKRILLRKPRLLMKTEKTTCMFRLDAVRAEINIQCFSVLKVLFIETEVEDTQI